MKTLLYLLVSFLTFNAFGKTVIVKLKKPLNKEITSQFKGKWKKFSNAKYKSDYFSSLYYYGLKDDNQKKALKGSKFVESVEEIIEVSASSIEVPDITTQVTKDDHTSYQWGLFFQGQKVYNELDDLNNILIPGKKTSDIGLSNLKDFGKDFQRDAVVAVIDTGVDYNHPDLKTNIATNDVECENGEIPFEPEASNDDNEQKGDCKGWNFTGSKEEGNNRPEDFVGHGTHIAGIIAAVKNNGDGISGVSNKIKVLPIKVLSNEGEDAQAIGTSDRLSKAIQYAIDMKVDVINLSLGWPLSFDKEHLKQAVMDAIKADIIVVSAAGNNDHSEPIMPCAYEGVVCVGSNDPDTKMSDFSNYGAHVDVLAPGNNILSTYPTGLTPLFFDINGYEIKSGTSQAAPYVSALAASIKGTQPELSAKEVKAKIYASARSPYIVESKFASGNIISFDRALGKTEGIIKPNLKGFGRVKVDFKTRTFSFPMKFEDFGNNAELLKVQVNAEKGVNLTQTTFDLGLQRKILVQGKLDNLDLNLLQKFKVTLNYGKFSEAYNVEKRFYIDFEEIDLTKAYEIIGANPKSVTEFSTVNDNHAPYDFPFYYTVSTHKQGKIISVFSKDGPVIKNLGTTLLPEVKTVLSIHRVDANLDGEVDYLIRTLNETIKPKENEDDEEEKEESIVYHYLSSKLRPLFSKVEEVDGQKKRTSFSSMKLQFESVILQDLNDFAFGKIKYGDFGEILIPVYTSFANSLPEADRNPNPFARLRQRSFSARIYYYEPVIDGEEVSLVTRTLNNNKFVDSFKRKIKFRPYEQIFVVKFLKQSYDDIKKGVFSLLISHESERKQARNYILKISDIAQRKWSVEKTSGTALNLSQFISERGIDLTANTILAHDADRKIVGYEKSTRLAWEEYSFDANERIDYVSIEQENIYDSLEYPIKTYFDSEGTFRFYLTPSRIYLERETLQGKEKYSYPVHVSSFLPGMLFREQHYPITFAEDNKTIPALYVDSTQIASRNIYLLKASDKGITAPIRFNVNIPENCRALNPVIVDKYKYEYSIQCFLDRGKSKIFYVPLEN